MIGAATAWPDNSVKGVFIGSVAGALILSGVTMAQASNPNSELPALGAVLLFIFAPITAMIAMVISLFRWALNQHLVAIRSHQTLALRLGIPPLLILLSVGLGWTHQYPPQARQVLERTQAMITAGLSAGPGEELPRPLQAREVGNFVTEAPGPYTLQWEQDKTNRYQIPRPGNTDGLEALVIARFESGWMLVCLYPRPDWEARCKAFPPGADTLNAYFISAKNCCT
jgi:hypothetical protein